MSKRSTWLCTFRRLIEKFKQNKRHLHMVFIDLKKAYDGIPDSIPGEVFCQMLEKKDVYKIFTCSKVRLRCSNIQCKNHRNKNQYISHCNRLTSRKHGHFSRPPGSVLDNVRHGHAWTRPRQGWEVSKIFVLIFDTG